MPSLIDELHDFLAARRQALGPPSRVVVAFSGGRDSTVLLAATAEVAPALGLAVRAAHVNHGLEAAADDWERHCIDVASRLGVACDCRRVAVNAAGGGGLEANARRARYQALADLAGDGWLLTAHHRDDQAETVLLNLMRGSGVAGVRGAAAWRPLGSGWLMRPLLGCAGDTLETFARQRALPWIEDPSNSDAGRDRNFLRHAVLPPLAQRWPAAGRMLARSAAHAAEAAGLLAELADLDLAAAGDDPARLELAALAALSPGRRRNLLRRACARLGLPLPPARQLAAIDAELATARADGVPQVTWPGGEARRFRGRLYLLPVLPETPAGGARLLPGGTLALGSGVGALSLCEAPGGGIDPGLAAAGLGVRFRQGGECLRPAGGDRRRPLKKLLQEAGIVPWMRERIPLLYAGDALVAVGDLWVANDCHDAAGFAVRWADRPALY